MQLGSGTGAQPFKTVADYENWRKRAAKMPAIFDQAIANSREGMKHGVVQPKALMAKVVPQLDALIKDSPTRRCSGARSRTCRKTSPTPTSSA